MLTKHLLLDSLKNGELRTRGQFVNERKERNDPESPKPIKRTEEEGKNIERRTIGREGQVELFDSQERNHVKIH